MFAKPHPALVSRITAHPTLHRASSPSFAGMRPSNSFALTLLSDPHPLTPITSILYKNIGGEGASTSQSPSPIACPLAQFPLNSHGIMSFADPHPLTRLESYRFKNIGERVLRTSDLPKSFVCNIYGPSRKCCKHRAYKDVKSVRCNTYKKQGGSVMVNQTADGGCLSRATIRSRGISLHAKKDSRLPRPSFRGAPFGVLPERISHFTAASVTPTYLSAPP